MDAEITESDTGIARNVVVTTSLADKSFCPLADVKGVRVRVEVRALLVLPGVDTIGGSRRGSAVEATADPAADAMATLARNGGASHLASQLDDLLATLLGRGDELLKRLLVLVRSAAPTERSGDVVGNGGAVAMSGRVGSAALEGTTHAGGAIVVE